MKSLYESITQSRFTRREIGESILDNDDKIRDDVSSRMHDLCTPDSNHRVRVNMKDWIKYADLEQYTKFLDDGIYELRKARSEYDSVRVVRLNCEDGEISVRLYKETTGGRRGWIFWDIALSRKSIPSVWRIPDEYVKQRDKIKDWRWWTYLSTGTTRKQCIEKIKQTLQTNIDNLFIQ